MTDSSHSLQHLQEQVQEAFACQQPLAIQGGGSKAFYAYPDKAAAVPISTLGHAGIIDYQPNELVITARAGTPLSEIEQVLSDHDQMLSCEPPHFSENASFGGMIAAGLSGPRRPFGNSIADLILGCKILNGKGELLKFGGQVMKNVAGYDSARLMAGSLGCLGIILEASVKVIPKPKADSSYRFNIGQAKTTEFVNKLRLMGYPVSASSHDNQHLTLRFSASEKEIEGLSGSLQNDFGFIDFEEELLKNYWADLRDQRCEFFKNAEGESIDTNIWRLSLAPNTPALDLPGTTLLEWNGAQRWLKTAHSGNGIFKELGKLNGSATLFRKAPLSATHAERIQFIFQPLAAPLMHWQQQLKKAFDPAGIFNPGKMYRDL